MSTNSNGTAPTDASGYYNLPLLSPGLYRLRASASGYQNLELYNLEVPVAGRVEVNLRLRPLSDLWEAGQYRSVFLPGAKTIVTFYGPDLDESRSGSFEAPSGRRGALVSTLSDVIDPIQVRDLPMAGRDVYTMLLTQPGITADSGTARGLGLSGFGQRPSASNFLLDGLENNNYLVTGPLTAIAPEAIQEYRVSTGNYSAEFGRTSGYLANAVTRAGGNEFHGVGYLYSENEIFNAADFQDNRKGLGRDRVSEHQFGYQAGGPILRDRLFVSSAFEQLRSRGFEEPVTLSFPSPQFVRNFTAPASNARKLLEQYAPPAVTPDPARSWLGSLELRPPVTVDRSLALERVDYHRGRDQFMGRVAIARLARPDFAWSPYPEFTSAFLQTTLSVAAGYQRSIHAGLTNELRAGYSRDPIEWDRPHPEIPSLFTGDDVVLPGSYAFYAYRNRGRSWQFVDNLIWSRGRHLFSFGGGILMNQSSGYLTAGRDGQYLFDNLPLFGADLPRLFAASIARGGAVQPSYDREYVYEQPYFFVQDAFKATSRLVLNFGMRYEHFDAPRSVGSAKETLVDLGPGASLAERLAGGKIVSNASEPYGADNQNWAVRLGASYDLFGNGRTLVRGGYGVFYDRPFDNLWQNVRTNSFVVPIVPLRGKVDYLQPVADTIRSLPSIPEANFPTLTLFDPELRNGYAHNYFYGIERELSDTWSIEVNGVGSVARSLITTDLVNREFTTPTFPGRINPGLPDIAWRAGQGFSNYQGMASRIRRRGQRAHFEASYTWSHSIDNQSEPLAGDAFDLSFTRISDGSNRVVPAAFSRQFDPRADRGSSDFDQRHNLVFYSIWNLPFRWKFSQLAAFRSGFPYSVFASSDDFPTPGQGLIVNNRADVIDPAQAILDPRPNIAGGKRLLNPAAFRAPAQGTLGNSGRNAFRGPGHYNLDVSLSRTFSLPWPGESGRVTLRADSYNVLNHANLSNPHPYLGDAAFGFAAYGRQGRASGFPSVVPFTETARRLELMLRFEW